MAENKVRDLFPNMFNPSGAQKSSRVYWDTVQEGLPAAYQALKGLKDNKSINPDDLEAVRAAVRKETVGVWCKAEETFTASILDGTVDSFPPLLIWEGASVKKGIKDSDTGEEFLFSTPMVDVEVDYFGSAKAAIEAAKHYDPLAVTDCKDKDWIPGSSTLSHTLRPLYAYKKSKFPRRNLLIQRFFRTILIFIVSVLALFGARALFYRHLDAQTLRTLLSIVTLALVLLILVTIYRFFRLLPEVCRSFVYNQKSLKYMWAKMVTNKVSVIVNYPNAKKQLLFYQLWRSRLASAVKKGYEIMEPNVRGQQYVVLSEMDEVISEMKDIISYIEKNYREPGLQLKRI